MNTHDSTAKLLKSLTHPARLAILDILRRGEACVCHLEAALGYRQAYISQHLMVLRDAGLVTDRREGWNVYYHVTQPEIFAVIDAARSVTAQARQSPNPAFRPASRLGNCPCPHCNPAVEKVAC